MKPITITLAAALALTGAVFFVAAKEGTGMKRIFLCLLLALSLTANAFALEVPTDSVIRDLNGSHQLVKTYTLPPDTDPQELIEAPFEQEGFLYTYADIVKTENQRIDTISKSETVTLETSSNDLAAILAELPSTKEYDDGIYTGTLSLDHSSIHTEASGYTRKTSTVSATKTIGPVDRNDMSYVPTTTVKDGVTLNLAGVEWQVTGSDVVGESLAAASYQAVATYTGKSSYSVATGYVTTAEYTGAVTSSGVENITYQVTYIGTSIDEIGANEAPAPVQKASITATIKAFLPHIAVVLGMLVIVFLTVQLVRARKELQHFQKDEPEEDEEEHEKEDEHE